MSAKFPGALAGDSDLLVAVNLIQTTLSAPMGLSDTTASLTSGAGMPTNCVFVVDGEVCLITANGNTNTPTIQRAYDGTAAATHPAQAVVSAYIVAHHHNQMAKEVEAIETALGVSLANVAPKTAGTAILKGDGAGGFSNAAGGTDYQAALGYTAENVAHKASANGYASLAANSRVPMAQLASGAANGSQFIRDDGTLAVVPVRMASYSPDFNFAAQPPGGSLGVGGNTITFPNGIPAGITADSIGVGSLYLSGGVGSAEVVPITGVNVGANQVTVTCANTHSGAWTIQSSTAGIQEAIIAAGGAGAVFVPPGQYTVLGDINVPGTYATSLRGAGPYVTILNMVGLAKLVYLTGAGAIGGGIDFGSMMVQDSAGVLRASGDMVAIHNRAYGEVSDLLILWSYNALNVDRNSSVFYHSIAIGCANYGLWINTNNISGAGGAVSAGDYYGIFVTTSGTTANGIRIDGSTVGITFTNCHVGSLNNTNTNYCLVINQTALGATNELQFSNCMFDGHGNGILISGYGTYGNNRIVFADCGVSPLANCYAITGKMQGISITGGVASAASAGAHAIELGDCRRIIIAGVAIDAPTGGGGSVGINCSGAASDVLIAGCQFGFNNVMDYGIGGGGTPANWRVSGSQFSTTIANTAVNQGTPLIRLNGDNAGIDDVVPAAVASAATITAPIHSLFPVSGTTSITTINGGWTGCVKIIFKTDAGPVTIGGGGNIPLSRSLAQNGSVTLRFNGTNWY